MPSAADLSMIVENRGTTLFVGASGDGKSCAAVSFPTPILWFDFDKRWKGIMGHPLLAHDKERLKNIEVLQYDRKNLDKAADKLNLLQAQAANPASFPYKTVLYDGISSYDDLIMAKAIELTGGSKQIGGKPVAGWDEYRFEHRSFTDTVLALKMLPCNVIVTAHWVDDYDDEGKKSGKKINLRDKVWNSVCKYIDEIYYFEKQDRGAEGSRFMSFFRSRLARTTHLSLPVSLDWTGQNFYDLWQAALHAEAKTAGGDAAKK